MALLDRVIDPTTPRAERERAEQIDAVRALLDNPPGARTTNAAGGLAWAKPPKRTAGNVRDVLRLDPAFRSRLALNDFSGSVEWEGRLMEDADTTEIRLMIADLYEIVVSTALMHEMLIYVARMLRYHPVRDWLESIRWDGVPRISKLLATYAGCDDTQLNETLSRRFLISCVARIMQPGEKVDTVLILAGPQGYGKSSFFRALASPEWFRDSAIDMRNKDAYQSLKGAWVYEMAELAAMRPRDAETVKAFLSAQVDHYRPPYGRNMIEQKRQVVFVGTTNEPSFLSDPTGARRFWPVKVSRMPTVADVERDRVQLWAEAVVAYQGNERWWLELNESEALTESQEQYQHEDPWAPKVERWIAQQASRTAGLTVEDVLDSAIDKDGDKQTKGDEMRIGGILTALGFEKRRRMVGGVRRWRWFPIG